MLLSQGLCDVSKMIGVSPQSSCLLVFSITNVSRKYYTHELVHRDVQRPRVRLAAPSR